MRKKDKTYYQILGVSSTASATDIKRAYRKIAKEQHPDFGHQHKSEEERARLTEEMAQINEAYENLADKKKRDAYDVKIGVTVVISQPFKFAKNTEDEVREIYLAKIFNPSRLAVARVIQKYKKQIRDLSQDPYDDELIANFQEYLDEVEEILSKASKQMSSRSTPSSLVPAVTTLRQCVAQAADALDELNHFCRNYNYDHLSTAESLFRIAFELSKKAFELTKIA